MSCSFWWALMQCRGELSHITTIYQMLFTKSICFTCTDCTLINTSVCSHSRLPCFWDSRHSSCCTSHEFSSLWTSLDRRDQVIAQAVWVIGRLTLCYSVDPRTLCWTVLYFSTQSTELFDSKLTIFNTRPSRRSTLLNFVAPNQK